jgi:hypothetical protein
MHGKIGLRLGCWGSSRAHPFLSSEKEAAKAKYTE